MTFEPRNAGSVRRVLGFLFFFFLILLGLNSGFPGGSDWKEYARNAGDPGSIPGSGRFLWRRAWQPTPILLPGESPWTEEPGGLQSMRPQKV